MRPPSVTGSQSGRIDALVTNLPSTAPSVMNANVSDGGATSERMSDGTPMQESQGDSPDDMETSATDSASASQADNSGTPMVSSEGHNVQTVDRTTLEIPSPIAVGLHSTIPLPPGNGPSQQSGFGADVSSHSEDKGDSSVAVVTSSSVTVVMSNDASSITKGVSTVTANNPAMMLGPMVAPVNTGIPPPCLPGPMGYGMQPPFRPPPFNPIMPPPPMFSPGFGMMRPSLMMAETGQQLHDQTSCLRPVMGPWVGSQGPMVQETPKDIDMRASDKIGAGMTGYNNSSARPSSNLGAFGSGGPNNVHMLNSQGQGPQLRTDHQMIGRTGAEDQQGIILQRSQGLQDSPRSNPTNRNIGLLDHQPSMTGGCSSVGGDRSRVQRLGDSDAIGGSLRQQQQSPGSSTSDESHRQTSGSTFLGLSDDTVTLRRQASRSGGDGLGLHRQMGLGTEDGHGLLRKPGSGVDDSSIVALRKGDDGFGTHRQPGSGGHSELPSLTDSKIRPLMFQGQGNCAVLFIVVI